MVAAAILAASPHNIQPWIFEVSGKRIGLYTDPARRTGVLDPLGREHLVGLGCALENRVIAAGLHGYSTEVTLVPGDNLAHVATVALPRIWPEPGNALYDAIAGRHSNRGPCQSTPVPARVPAELGAQATGLPGLESRRFTSASERAALGALMIEAARSVVGDQQQSVDGFAWFRAAAGRRAPGTGSSGSIACQRRVTPYIDAARVVPGGSRDEHPSRQIALPAG